MGRYRNLLRVSLVLCLVSFSGCEVVILNSLLGDRVVISKTDDVIQSYEALSADAGQGELCVCVQ